MKNESTSSGTGSNQHLSSAGTRYVGTELDEGESHSASSCAHSLQMGKCLMDNVGGISGATLDVVKMTSGRGYIELCFCLQAVLYILPTLCRLELFCVLHLTPLDNQCSSDTCVISTMFAILLHCFVFADGLSTKFSEPHRQLHVVSANWRPQLNDEHLSWHCAGSLYPEQLQELHGRSPSNLLSPDAGPSQQICSVPAEPSPKMSDDNAGDSSDKGDGRRKKLTKKQAQELEEIFQADHSGAPGMLPFNRERKPAFLQTRWLVPANSVASWVDSPKVRNQLGACPDRTIVKRALNFHGRDN
jgi:hypothetical protein